MPALRVDPQERAAAAEVAERPRRVVRARPVRRLRVAELEAEAPVVRLLPAEAGQHAHEPGELHRSSPRRASPPRSASARAARARARAGRRACRTAPEPGEPVEPRSIPSGPSTAARSTRRTASRRASDDRLGRDLEAVVRVDPPRARARDRRAVVERQAGRVGEQVPQRRARRAGRLVEVDDPLLGGDEHAIAVASFVTDAQRNSRSRRRVHRPPPAAATPHGDVARAASRRPGAEPPRRRY